MKNAPHNPKDEMNEHRRMMLAVVVSLAILTGYQFFFAKTPEKPLPPAQEQAAAVPAAQGLSASGPRLRDAVLREGARIPVRGAKVTGSVSRKGQRLDDLLLNGHYKTVERAENVPLLNPAGTAGAFYVESGWLAAQGGVTLPGQDTVWRLAPGSAAAVESGGPPVVLQWDNGQGVMFERAVSVDENYLFRVTQRVTNNTAAPLTLNPYHLTARDGLPPDFSNFYVMHEGPVARLGGKSYEPSYGDLSGGETVEAADVTGWAGITDKYWLVAVLPQPDAAFNARIVGAKGATAPHFQADIVGRALTVAPGAAAEDTVHVYAGVKSLRQMQAYGEAQGIDRLDTAIDFGIWYMITKPFYILFHFLVSALGNAAGALLAMTLVVRAAVFPLATKSYVSMAKMKTIMPQLKALQEKHAQDKAALQMEVMELYRREGANPFSGCWPMIVQIPIFFALYKVILISVDLRHAPFWGWVRDMSAPDPTSVFNLFGLIPWEPPQMLMIGAWPVLFCLTMVLQKRLSPPMPDPVQEKLQAYFPYIITVMLAHFASGLVIYWAWSNTLAVLQQYYILRKVGGEDVSLVRGHHTRRKPKKAKKKAGREKE